MGAGRGRGGGADAALGDFLDFPPGFCTDLAIGASVSTDGVCLTVTEILSENQATFDVMLQSLAITTLGSYAEGDSANVERASKDGAEIGGHPLSGHVDFTSQVLMVKSSDTDPRQRSRMSRRSRRLIRRRRGRLSSPPCRKAIPRFEAR